MSEHCRVVLAAIIGAHGLQGELRLKLFAESLASLKRHKAFEAGGRPLTLKSVREGPGGAIARFAEIPDRTAAEAYRGLELSVPRESLPPPAEGEVYVADLIGLPALADGAEAGRVVSVENYGAGDLVEIERPEGARILIPFARCTLRPGALDVDSAFLD